MAIIDVGPGAIDGDTAGISIDDYTFITTGNPANQTGSLDTFEIWLNLKNGSIIIKINMTRQRNSMNYIVLESGGK